MSRSDQVSGRRPFLSFEALTALLPMVDLAIIIGSSILAPIIVLLFLLPSGTPPTNSLYGLGLVASGLYVFRMRDLNHYEPHALRGHGVEVRDIIQTWAATLLVLLSLIYLFKLGQLNTRRTFLVFVLIAPTALLTWRAIVKWTLPMALDRQAVGRRDAMLIGDLSELRPVDVDRMLSLFGIADIERFALVDETDGPLSDRDRQSLERAITHAQANNVEQVLIVVNWSHAQRLAELREMLRALPSSARLLPDRTVRALTGFPSTNPEHCLQVDLQRAPLTFFERAVKRGMDIVLSAVGLVVLSPLMAIVALVVRLESPGPALFKQRRIGFNRREFMIYKFRSMRVEEDGAAVRQATRGDARITRFGRFIRATSIDELPQLLNVLRGEMSLVGPRPHALVHDHEFEKSLAEYAFRRHMKPGITGWAQCKGRRGPTPTVEDVRDRVELDLWYITNWSLSLDVYILFRTIFVLFGQKNAL